MAEEALLEAVRDHLRAALRLDDAECEVMADGRPMPSAGEFFAAVHEGEWRADEGKGDEGLHEVMGVLVTVTLRCGSTPFDRIGTDVLAKARRGLLARAREVVAALARDRQQVRQLANAKFAGEDPAAGSVNGYFTAPKFRDGGRVEARGPEWFHAKGKSGAPVGLSRTLTFGGAERSQYFSEAT